MPSLDKKTKLWIGSVQRVGFPRRIKRGFKTKTIAKEWERTTLLCLMNPVEISSTYSEISGKYLLWCEIHREPNTTRQKYFIFTSLADFWNSNPDIDKIDKKMIESYLDSLTKEKKDENKSPITPLVESLSGVINLSSDFDYKKEYSDYLIEKYK